MASPLIPPQIACCLYLLLITLPLPALISTCLVTANAEEIPYTMLVLLFYHKKLLTGEFDMFLNTSELMNNQNYIHVLTLTNRLCMKSFSSQIQSSVSFPDLSLECGTRITEYKLEQRQGTCKPAERDCYQTVTLLSVRWQCEVCMQLFALNMCCYPAVWSEQISSDVITLL